MQQRPTFAVPRLTPFTRFLLIGLGVIYVAELVIVNWVRVPVVAWLALGPPSIASAWQVFTHAFVHDPSPQGVGSFLISMLFLWWMLAPFEERWGPKRAAQLVVVAAVGTGLVALAVGMLALAFGGDRLVEFGILGASPVLLATIAAFGTTLRDQVVSLFGLFAMKAMTLVWVSVGFAALTFLADRNVVSLGASLGAIGAGYLFARWMTRPRTRRPALRAVRDSGPPRYLN